jgi:hemolysin activation/secretion protein
MIGRLKTLCGLNWRVLFILTNLFLMGQGQGHAQEGTEQDGNGSTQFKDSNRENREKAALAEPVISLGGTSVFGSASTGPSLQYGQSFQDYAPQSLRSGPLKPGKKIGEPVEAVLGADDLVTDRLVAVLFLGSVGEVAVEGKPGIKGVVSSVSDFPQKEAQRISDQFLKKPANLRDLNEICHRVSKYYQDRNQPVVTVMIPEQKVSSGSVQILVIRGKIGRVKVEGDKYFNAGNIADAVRLREGDSIDLSTLTDDVNWLNGNMFRQVQPSLSPGSKEGETDVLLEVKDRFPFHPYVSYDNYGIQSLGYDRYSTGFTMIDAWTGWDQQLSYQYLTSGGFNNLVSNSGSYSTALPWHHNLTFLGSYSVSNPDAVGVLDQQGYYWQASMRYQVPLPTLSMINGLDFRQQAYAGYDFKAANSDLFFNGEALTPTTGGLVGLYNISQFVLGYAFTLVDPLGTSSFETVMNGSPGGMTSNNSNESFQNVNLVAESAYLYGKFSLNRNFLLPGGVGISLSGQIQQSNSALMPSESFGIGGYDTVRGYDQRAANGDNGYLGNVEVRSPAISIWSWLGAKERMDSLIFLGFFDYGQVLQLSDESTTSVNAHMMSVGPGLRYNIGSYVTVRFDWGFQLQQAPAGTTGGSGGRPGTSQAVLSLMAAY